MFPAVARLREVAPVILLAGILCSAGSTLRAQHDSTYLPRYQAPVAAPLAPTEINWVGHSEIVDDTAGATAAESDPAGDCDDGHQEHCECDRCCALPRRCDRWYIGLSGGWQQRETVHEADDARTFIEFDDGFGINGAIGYRFDVFRVEFETSFMNNECAQAGAGGLSSGTVGNVNLRAFMFNAYHDFQIGEWRWIPYLGAGIGIYQSELNGLYPEFFDVIGPPFAGTPVNATSDMPFAYQFRAGLSRELGERTDFHMGYRYFHGDELTFSSAPFATFAPTFHPDGAWTHGIEVGLRVKF